MKNTDFFKIRACSLNSDATEPKRKNIKTKPCAAHTGKKTKGLQSLLDNSSKSHCNTFVGYSRIPHKYDHFHEKTFPGSTVGSFMQNFASRSLGKKPEPQRNLILLSESLDVAQIREFFSHQQAYKKVSELNKFSSYRITRNNKKTKVFP